MPRLLVYVGGLESSRRGISKRKQVGTSSNIVRGYGHIHLLLSPVPHLWTMPERWQLMDRMKVARPEASLGVWEAKQDDTHSSPDRFATFHCDLSSGHEIMGLCITP